MIPYFKNTYLVPSTRLPGYDYSEDGWYFVTICTEDRVCYFGGIIDGEMVLSKIGEIVT